MKKGEIVWNEIYTWIIVIVFAIVVLLIIFSDKMFGFNVLQELKDLLRFGV